MNYARLGLAWPVKGERTGEGDEKNGELVGWWGEW